MMSCSTNAITFCLTRCLIILAGTEHAVFYFRGKNNDVVLTTSFEFEELFHLKKARVNHTALFYLTHN